MQFKIDFFLMEKGSCFSRVQLDGRECGLSHIKIKNHSMAKAILPTPFFLKKVKMPSD
jgi:hypothetical protein